MRVEHPHIPGGVIVTSDTGVGALTIEPAPAIPATAKGGYPVGDPMGDLMTTLSEIQALTDPVAKAAAATQLVRDLDAAIRPEYTRRDIAGLILHYRLGWKPVAIYRDLFGVQRNKWTKIMARAPEPLPGMRNPEKVAREAVEKIAAYEEQVVVVRELRNKMVLALLDGSAGVPPMSNAEVARATGLDTARVAQLRHGN
jgi:hypothetical protein